MTTCHAIVRLTVRPISMEVAMYLHAPRQASESMRGLARVASISTTVTLERSVMKFAVCLLAILVGLWLRPAQAQNYEFDQMRERWNNWEMQQEAAQIEYQQRQIEEQQQQLEQQQ